ncbi:MAG: hypothetical protein ABIO39_05495 [Caulobacteraceae bacterium]
MPRYFFNIENGEFTPDTQGVVLSGLVEVQSQAQRLAGEMLQDGSARLWETGEWRLDITNEAGDSVCVLNVATTKGAE